jgi:hypothetical protein
LVLVPLNLPRSSFSSSSSSAFISKKRTKKRSRPMGGFVKRQKPAE